MRGRNADTATGTVPAGREELVSAWRTIPGRVQALGIAQFMVGQGSALDNAAIESCQAGGTPR